MLGVIPERLRFHQRAEEPALSDWAQQGVEWDLACSRQDRDLWGSSWDPSIGWRAPPFGM